jgi:DNA replication and repair protein RecF
VVALSSHDLQLVRGVPQARRRALDLALSSLDERYFTALRRYHAALDNRNALLRGPRAPAPEALAAFEAVMMPEAAAITTARAAAVAELGGHLVKAYDRLTDGARESPELVYMPESKPNTLADWGALWEESRPRDLTTKTTTRGPHRDDFAFRLEDHGAKPFGSEGQQRGLVVAWRLAEAAWQRARTGIAPLVLADDVLGELDPARRAGFWRAASDAAQVIATGTTPPAPEVVAWEVWNVNQGIFSLA